MDVRREQIPLLWSTVGDTALPLAKGFVFLGVGYEVFECVCRRTKGCACRFLQLLPGSVYSEDLALFRVNVYVPSALPCREPVKVTAVYILSVWSSSVQIGY